MGSYFVWSLLSNLLTLQKLEKNSLRLWSINQKLRSSVLEIE